MRAEGVAPHYFLYSIPKLYNHPNNLCWEKQHKNTTVDGLEPS